MQEACARNPGAKGMVNPAVTVAYFAILPSPVNALFWRNFRARRMRRGSGFAGFARKMADSRADWYGQSPQRKTPRAAANAAARLRLHEKFSIGRRPFAGSKSAQNPGQARC